MSQYQVFADYEVIKEGVVVKWGNHDFGIECEPGEQLLKAIGHIRKTTCEALKCKRKAIRIKFITVI